MEQMRQKDMVLALEKLQYFQEATYKLLYLN